MDVLASSAEFCARSGPRLADGFEGRQSGLSDGPRSRDHGLDERRPRPDHHIQPVHRIEEFRYADDRSENRHRDAHQRLHRAQRDAAAARRPAHRDRQCGQGGARLDFGEHPPQSRRHPCRQLRAI